jgi:hypothetical protein
MRKIKNYQDFRNQEVAVNEEFIGALVKGALGKLANAFMAPFKDMAKDFKDLFKEDDPNSIKSVIFSNLDKAIDEAQKKIPEIKDDASLVGVIDNFADTLVQLGNNIGKDITTAFGKEKSPAVTELSKAVILGSKELDWVGIVGAIDPSKGSTKQDMKFKFSKSAYQSELAKGKDLKSKQQIAIKFFDNLQKQLRADLDKELSKEDIEKYYKELQEKSGQVKEGEMTYDKVKEFYDKKTPVLYLLKGKTKEDWDKLTDDQKKKPNEKPASDIAGLKEIVALNDQNKPDSVTFNDKDGNPTIKKSYAEILGPAEGVEEQRSEEAKQAAEELGKIKADPDKMKKVANFAKFLQDEKNKDKVAEVEKILSGGREPAKEA